MLTIPRHEYLQFLSKYFSINPEIIFQKSIENHIIDPSDSEDVIIEKLKSALGYQRRLLEPLNVALSKSTPFDSIVALLTFKIFDKHCSFLIADQNNIFKLIYFRKELELDFSFTSGEILKIDSCYFKEGKLFTNNIPKPIWFYDFPTIFTIKEFFLDNLPECIYDEAYTSTTNIVHIIGYFYVLSREDHVFCFIHSQELRIRIIPYKTDDLDLSLANKLVRVSYCELDYGPDSYQLKMTEFSNFKILSTVPKELTNKYFRSLIRFEYPSYRMSLSELTDKTVAITKVKLILAEKGESSWQFYGYDSSQAFCLTVFDDLFAEQMTSLMSDTSYFLIDGIYKRGKKYYIRERITNIHVIEFEDEEDISIPISNPNNIIEEKLVIIDLVITEILEKNFVTQDNKTKRFEKIRGISHNQQISINNYNRQYFQKFLVGKSYRVFFVNAKFYAGNLYFILNENSVLSLIT